MDHGNQFSSMIFLENLIKKFSDNTHDSTMTKEEIIDGLKWIREEFRQLKELDFREIGDHLYDGLYIADGNGKTLYVNKAYTRITGLKAEEVVDKYVNDIIKEGLYKNAVTPEVIKQKKQVNSMGTSTRNGIKMLITGNPILDQEGNVKKVVVIDREITDLLAMQAEVEATQQKMKAVEKDERKRKQEIQHLRKIQLNQNLIGKSIGTQQVTEKIHQIANLDVTVLIMGETGTGKEVVADEIYLNSMRKEAPFIKVNCAAIPATLLEAELFGYEKGSFTGASISGKMGMFELADKGTLLLDEIGEMTMELQSKLLRVIQHKEVTRIGGRRPVKLDVRILAATNCELREMVQKGKFREDLYYRLNVFPIHIPPLRLRGEDIILLTQHFLSIYNGKYGKFTIIEALGMEVLMQYFWPGNIRELKNIIERLVIVSDHSAVISGEQIAILLNLEPYYAEFMNKEIGLKEIVANVEKKTIEKALATYGSTRKVAKVLKIDQSTVVKKAKKLGIGIGDEKENR
ncbi:sigma-54 interaction domain-containing protein [Pelosinus propionicus]|uniref:HTH-type transcriptional regulatory protein TyrR n=1 Tax=Pelosinus propionicus DSM 13327 TaxID=1123291 RepID=A0A1I4LYV1_9FIRM|nr:sigma 54-interacting transcriptional regulator [Pelosinus propionicus]SFL96104.1 PAS domain S-box-containing protein [Pelosinus propionicus DSM 13327]